LYHLATRHRNFINEHQLHTLEAGDYGLGDLVVTFVMVLILIMLVRVMMMMMMMVMVLK